MIFRQMIEGFKRMKYDRLVCRGPTFLKYVRDELKWDIDKKMLARFVSSKKDELIGYMAMLTIVEGGKDWPPELIQLQNLDANKAVYIHFAGGRWIPISKEVVRIIRETSP